MIKHSDACYLWCPTSIEENVYRLKSDRGLKTFWAVDFTQNGTIENLLGFSERITNEEILCSISHLSYKQTRNKKIFILNQFKNTKISLPTH